ncbi:MAG TPA: hypothetical protein VL551_02525 [Actinospica sp.]|nr:hypothetical protein [Actinospica sp.]
MHVTEILTLAADEVAADPTSPAGLAAAEARVCLDADELELTLDVLAELDGGTARFWELLADAADQMYLERTRRWCLWRRYESINGVIRAELSLLPPSAGGRSQAVPGDGVLRPMWNLTLDPAAAKPALHTARIWVEHAPEIEPGSKGTIRLAPLMPEHWRHLSSGAVITMHERAPVAGSATIVEISPSVPTRPAGVLP